MTWLFLQHTNPSREFSMRGEVVVIPLAFLNIVSLVRLLRGRVAAVRGEDRKGEGGAGLGGGGRGRSKPLTAAAATKLILWST